MSAMSAACATSALTEASALPGSDGAHGTEPDPAKDLRCRVEVVHADALLLVIAKPAGLLAVPGRGDAGRDSLAVRVQALWPDALVVHRLDQATSGLMLFARGAAVQRALSALFRERRVHKRYEAWVHGRVAGDCGSIALPLAADWPRRPRQRVDLAHGRPSLTRWRILARAEAPQTARTRLELEPFTGRSHQLRVHLAALGHPIVGDALYAPPPPPPPPGLHDAGPLPTPASRLLLHATGLGLEHPGSGALVSWHHAAPF